MTETPTITKKYSLAEIDAMRQVIAETVSYASSCWYGRNISGGGPYNAKDQAEIVERRLRTALMAGVTLDETTQERDRAYEAFMSRRPDEEQEAERNRVMQAAINDEPPKPWFRRVQP